MVTNKNSPILHNHNCKILKEFGMLKSVKFLYQLVKKVKRAKSKDDSKRKRGKFILYAAPFSTDMSLGMINIALPLFAINLGANILTLGELGFIGPLFYTIFTPLFGRLSDYIGYKHLLLVGYLTYFFSFLALSLSTQLHQLFIFISFVGIAGAMFWPSFEVWTAESKTSKSLTKRVSFFNISWCIGASAGPLLGGILFQVYFRLPVYFVVFLSLLMSLLILRELVGNKGKNSLNNSRESLLRESLLKEDSPLEEKPSLSSRKALSLYLYIAWIANFASYFCIGTIRYLFPKLSTHLGIQPSILGILLCAMAFFQVLAFYILGKTTRWHYKWILLIFSQFLGILGLTLIFLGNSVAIFLLAFMLIGIEGGMVYFSSIFYSLNNLKSRGQKSGIHEAILGSGILSGSLVGGIFAQIYTLRTPYLLGIFIMGAAIIGETLLIRGKR